MFVNLTPHTIVIRPYGGEEITVPPSGTIARVEMAEHKINPINGIPAICRVSGKVTGIPKGGEAPERAVFLVSSMVLDALWDTGWGDVFAPDTGPTAIRDEKGHIVAVTRLVGL